ncbi:MAG: PhnD/SsuA/transferrin family substrate-binding protein [Rhabdochlamydiaceae bacterium]
MILLNFAANRYDKITSLINREIKIQDVELDYRQFPIAEIFFRQLKNGEFDLSDMSISFYLIARSSGNFPYIAIPVFPMREFFHSRIVVNTDSGIRKPQDLEGKRVGLPEYAVTASLWTRAVLHHEFGVLPEKIEWFVERSAQDSLAAAAGWKNPAGVRINEIPKEKSMLSMLNKGELDAAFIYRQEIRSRMERSTEDMFDGSKSLISRLFNDPKEETKRYYRKTGFYPINHLVILRESLARENPWLPLRLYEAFNRSKQLCLERNKNLAYANNSFIWLDFLQDEIDDIFSDGDPFPYGLKRNRDILEAITQYSFEQGLTSKRVQLEEMFHDSTLDT